ncbi:kinase-like domain-containing protein [Xylaria sp. FL1042]|nr:kinase-like domain-containing protein [Xylaria sp. FL1042]
MRNINARENKAESAWAPMKRIYAAGTFKAVYKGEYLTGENKGKLCVAKVFKNRKLYEDWQFDLELKIVNQTQSILDSWRDANIVRSRIRLNKPEIWRNESGSKAMVEPWLNAFTKWNSNSGWYDKSGSNTSDIMQALSHFSYHNSERKLLLCDLQGDVAGSGYILTDPAIISEKGAYGPADLGHKGIKDFFKQHKCTRYCDKKWRKPGDSGGKAHRDHIKGTYLLPSRH